MAAKKKMKKKATAKKTAKKPMKKKAAPKKAAKKVAKKAKPAKKLSKAKPAKKAVKKVAKKVAKAKPAKKSAAAKKPSSALAQNSAPKTPKAPKAAAVAPTEHALVGQSGADITLTNQRGESVNVAELVRSQPKVVLYFYPKDDTPGCTVEACNFRDNMNRIQSSGILVVGVSPDDAASHQKFIEKYGLNFDLLSDVDHKLAEEMKVWKEKNFMGRNYMGVERSTFAFKDGVISHGWQPVTVEGHVDSVLSTIE